MKIKTEMLLDLDNNTVIFEIDNGRGKPISIDLFKLIEENYGAKNARYVVDKLLRREQNQQDTVKRN